VRLAWLRAYVKTFEVVKRLQRPPRVGHVARAQYHPAQRNESFRDELGLDELAGGAVNCVTSVIAVLEDERQARCVKKIKPRADCPGFGY
jgi:hypothetical protein